MNVIEITKQLISIPSYVNNSVNESNIGTFLFDFCKSTFPNLQIQKQYVDKEKNRFNVYCSGSKNVTVLFLAHIDTVQPTQGWKTNPLLPVVKNNRIFGLGAGDMKGSIACLLKGLQEVKDSVNFENIGILFYVDEEYDFLGMKTFIKDYLPNKPKVVFSLDGDLQVASGCRGVIELQIIFTGKSAHSSKPFLGINAATRTVSLVNELEKKLMQFFDPYLGPTTVNLAYMQGGTRLQEESSVTWQREGNVVPDVAEITLEIRPSLRSVSADFVRKKIKALSKSLGLKVESLTIRHDIHPWPVTFRKKDIKLLQAAYSKTGIPFQMTSRTFSGYVDIQMLSEKLTCPMFVIGAGGENYHGANENVPIPNLMKAARLYEEILKKYC
ncbi:MAG: M20 family metallopeptidase [Candidatus Levybacteria bacterium]|nr:M20 family metallopeptidase [Candidatus Levybacteria bacterium]